MSNMLRPCLFESLRDVNARTMRLIREDLIVSIEPATRNDPQLQWRHPNYRTTRPDAGELVAQAIRDRETGQIPSPTRAPGSGTQPVRRRVGSLRRMRRLLDL